MSSFIGLFLAYTTLGIWQSSFISSSSFPPYGAFHTMKVSLGCKNILGINTWGRKWADAEKIFGLWCRPDKTLANSRLTDAELSCIGPKWSSFYTPSLLSHRIGIIYSKRALLSSFWVFLSLLSLLEADCERAYSWRLSADHRSRESSPLKSDPDHAWISHTYWLMVNMREIRK